MLGADSPRFIIYRGQPLFTARAIQGPLRHIEPTPSPIRLIETLSIPFEWRLNVRFPSKLGHRSDAIHDRVSARSREAETGAYLSNWE
jgi:hypothetical protein